MKITVIGTGYVGLITGAGLAEIGHDVTCLDIDAKKIEKLQKLQKMPIYEPGLENLVKNNINNNKLRFTIDSKNAIQNAEIIFIAVGTPLNDKGKADLRALYAVLNSIARYIDDYKVICIKSTVPIGTNKKAKLYLKAKISDDIKFDFVSNPEFLREGCAINDFFTINPIILGSNSDHALEIMQSVYKPMIEQDLSVLITNFETAETIKYAWNAFSATRITYVNELSRLCNAVGANIQSVVHGMSFSETLLPTKVLRPGPGIGGSCLPKDTQALLAIAKKYDVDLNIIKTVIKTNKILKLKIIDDLKKHIKKENLKGLTIAILGLSFKANTDDIRSSPAIPIIDKLIQDGAHIKVYDPQAMSNMQKIYPNISYCDSWQKAAKDANALILLTEWQEFNDIDLKKLAWLMKKRIVIDTRNIWNPIELMNNDFTYKNLGRIF